MDDTDRAEAIQRKATDEPEVMPMLPEFNAIGWKPERSSLFSFKTNTALARGASEGRVYTTYRA